MESFIEAAQKQAKKRSGTGRPKKTQVSNDTRVSKPQVDANRTAGKVASKVNSSASSIARAKAVKDRAPDLFKEMKAGTLKTNSAYSRLRQREKSAALEQKAKEHSHLIEQPEWSLIHGDTCDILDGRLDDQAYARLIFADPPYNIGIDYGRGAKADKLPKSKYLEWCERWMRLCHENLTDDGSFWLLVSDEFAAELCCIATDIGFHRRAWIKWFEGFGTNCSNNFNRTTRHIFWFVVDPKNFIFHSSEALVLSDRQKKYGDKRAAPGGKIENDLWDIPRLTGTCKERVPGFPTQIPVVIPDRIIRCASDPGDLILDPFNGSGTTGVAAIQNGRKYIGIDQSEKFIGKATKRLKVTEVHSYRGAKK
jgi:DNA modification methylase